MGSKYDFLVLAHDIGTSALKTSLVTSDCEIIAAARRELETRIPYHGAAEQDPHSWWAAAVENTRALIETHPAEMGAVGCIGVGGHMLGLVSVDGNGNPLAPALIHSDCRAAAEYAAIEAAVGKNELYRRTGNIPDARCVLAKMCWFKDNMSDAYAKTAVFIQSKDYLTGKMTRHLRSDYSDASHAMLIDLDKLAYMDDVFKELDIDTRKLPALAPGMSVAGRLTGEAARVLGLKPGIPVITGGGDGACASEAVSAFSAGNGDNAYVCVGTSAWVSRRCACPVIDSDMRLFNMVMLDGRSYGVFGTAQSAGRCVEWLGDLFGQTAREIDAMAARSPAGSGGLIFLPYLEGERCPVSDTDARGVFFGLAPSHNKEHMSRAVLEGVAFSLTSIVDVFRRSGPMSVLAAIGGGARSAFWMQMLADAAGLEVALPPAPPGDTTSLGVAVAALRSHGAFQPPKNAAAARYVPNPDNAAAYTAAYDMYRSLYPALRESFKRLAKNIPAFIP